MIKILCKQNEYEFEKELNALINKGWNPIYETFKITHILGDEIELINYYIILKWHIR